MKVVHDRRRSRRSPDKLVVDDLLTPESFDTELLGHAYLTETVGEPRRFLPPPRVRPRRQAPPPREPESRLSKVAKLAGLTTAGALLVGAVVASSMTDRTRSDQAGRPNPVPPQITGAAALGGFAIQQPQSHHSRPSSTMTTAAPLSAAQSPVSQTQPEPSSSASPEGTTTQTTSASPSNPPLSDAEKISLVKEFYHRVGSQRPESALDMLTPGLVGDEPGDLVRAWSSMSRVDVKQVSVQPDGSVLAVVDMLQDDGTRLRVTQVLDVIGSTSGHADGVISNAVLISADQL